MIIDTSSSMAIIFNESGWMLYEQAILATDKRLISAATLLEAMIVIEGRLGLRGGKDLDGFLARMSIETKEVTKEQAIIARAAWRPFGKGNHPARLNYGDCFSYALAKDTGLPLLYKGNDFAKTDIRNALLVN